MRLWPRVGAIFGVCWGLVLPGITHWRPVCLLDETVVRSDVTAICPSAALVTAHEVRNASAFLGKVLYDSNKPTNV
jgi:hypothetical protein